MTRPGSFNRLARVLSALAAAAALTGCSFELGGSTEGDAGRVTFSYGSWECLFGCELHEPVMVGSVMRVSLEGSGVDSPAIEVTSSDERVATFSIERDCGCDNEGSGSETPPLPDGECPANTTRSCTNAIRMFAVGGGRAKLELRRDGELLDRATVHVEPAARLELFAGDRRLGREVTLRVGDDLTVSAEAFGLEGQKLLLNGGIEWEATGESLVFEECWICDGDGVTLHGLTPGEADFVANVGDVEQRLHVVTP